MKNGEKKFPMLNTIALGIIMLLNVIWLVCYLISYSSNISFNFFLCLSELVIALIYALYDYKRPHGNLMRYLLLLYAVVVSIILIRFWEAQATYVNVMYLIIIISSTYMAGRLNKFKQNIILSLLILVCKCILSYGLIGMIGSVTHLTFVNVVACLGNITVWAAIAGGYIIRYKLHKEAAFSDKK